ncbi:MAG: BON domain-containing protein [Polaromonas sp.]|nr:BON domain-containing protein [Polaromonas sp.]
MTPDSTISFQSPLPARLVRALLVATLAGASLSACIPLLGTGAAGGALMAADRRTSGAQLEDEGIELRASSRVRNTPVAQRAHVNITSYNRQVLITGEAANLQDKQQVEQIVRSVENINSVVNDLQIGFISSLSTRSNDALLSGRVKARILDSRDLFLKAFKVFTESGTVYLMGRVTQREADRATEVARSVPGVQKVVRVFEIISEEELAGTVKVRTGAPAASTAAPAQVEPNAPSAPLTPLVTPVAPRPSN